MAIALFCYTTLSAAETSQVLDRLKCEQPDVFPECWWLSKVTDELRDDPAKENDFPASSLFLATWQKNDWGPMSAGVVRLFEEAFGAGRILALLEGEVVIRPDDKP